MKVDRCVYCKSLSPENQSFTLFIVQSVIQKSRKLQNTCACIGRSPRHSVAVWLRLVLLTLNCRIEHSRRPKHESLGENQDLTISRELIEVSHTAASLVPSPIEPSWIIKGNPVAQSAILSKSADGLAFTVVWQCSEGKFNWYYNSDETILILEGSIVLESDTMSPTRYSVGDVIFFKDGAHAKWHVEGHVRKLAFLRKTQPALLGVALRVYSKIKRTLVPTGKRPGPIGRN